MNRAQAHLQQVQKLSVEDLRKDAQLRLKALVTYHRQKSAIYHNLCKDATTPIIGKAELRRIHAALEKNRNVYKGKTSGSSGSPLFFFKDKWTHAFTWAVIRHYYAELGIQSGDLEARFYGMPLSGSSKWKEQLKDFVMNRKRFVVHDMSESMLKHFVDRFQKHPFKYLYGYSNALYYFAQHLEKYSITLNQLSTKLTCAIATAEQCNEDMRKLMEKTFGVPVYIEYGCSELGLIAIENKEKQMVVAEEQLTLEVVDESGETLPYGKPGRLIVSSLYNKAMPFIRYELGDIAQLKRSQEGRLIIEKLWGRQNEQIIMPNGNMSPGFTLYYVMKDFMELYPKLEAYQVVQQEDYSLLFLLKTDQITDESQALSKMIGIVKKYLPEIPKVALQKEEVIMQAPSGKFKHFVSKVHES